MVTGETAELREIRDKVTCPRPEINRTAHDGGELLHDSADTRGSCRCRAVQRTAGMTTIVTGSCSQHQSAERRSTAYENFFPNRLRPHHPPHSRRNFRASVRGPTSQLPAPVMWETPTSGALLDPAPPRQTERFPIEFRHLVDGGMRTAPYFHNMTESSQDRYRRPRLLFTILDFRSGSQRSPTLSQAPTTDPYRVAMDAPAVVRVHGVASMRC